MTTRAKITCFNCSNDYYVYKSEVKKDHVVHCPYCDAEIEQKMWDSIVHAIYTVADVNYHFRKYNDEYEEDLFQIDIEHVYVPLDKYKKLFSE